MAKPEYFKRWESGEITDVELLRLAGEDIAGIGVEFAPAIDQAKYAEKMRKEIQDGLKPAMDRLLTSSPSVQAGGVRFTKTNPQPKPDFDVEALLAFMDDLAVCCGGQVAVSYVLQRLAEAKRMRTATPAYKAEVIKERA